MSQMGVKGSPHSWCEYTVSCLTSYELIAHVLKITMVMRPERQELRTKHFYFTWNKTFKIKSLPCHRPENMAEVHKCMQNAFIYTLKYYKYHSKFWHGQKSTLTCGAPKNWMSKKVEILQTIIDLSTENLNIELLTGVTATPNPTPHGGQLWAVSFKCWIISKADHLKAPRLFFCSE